LTARYVPGRAIGQNESGTSDSREPTARTIGTYHVRRGFYGTGPQRRDRSTVLRHPTIQLVPIILYTLIIYILVGGAPERVRRRCSVRNGISERGAVGTSAAGPPPRGRFRRMTCGRGLGRTRVVRIRESRRRRFGVDHRSDRPPLRIRLSGSPKRSIREDPPGSSGAAAEYIYKY